MAVVLQPQYGKGRYDIVFSDDHRRDLGLDNVVVAFEETFTNGLIELKDVFPTLWTITRTPVFGGRNDGTKHIFVAEPLRRRYGTADLAGDIQLSSLGPLQDVASLKHRTVTLQEVAFLM